MKLLNFVANLLARYMAVVVLFVALLALFLPVSFQWIHTGWINPFLMVIMFCMGLGMKPDNFRQVLTHPKDILIGCFAQFTVMPLLALVLCLLFDLDAALTAGVILVGTCPGGTASNVVTYLAKGDVALSIGMTAVNTMLACFMTPFITWLMLHTTVTVDITSMFLSIFQVVLLPVGLGFILNHFFSRQTRFIEHFLPGIAVIAISLVVASIVSYNAEKIRTTGLILLAVVILHNLGGYLCGLVIGKWLKMPFYKTKALSVEIGMQNSGLATSLAATLFQGMTMATVPGALFSVWHNLSGAVLASLFRRMDGDETRQHKIPLP